jgi:protein phosphatase
MTLGRHAVATDPGRKRRHNEDAYVVEPPLFAVADGMGGAQAGEVASRLAAGALREGGGRLEDLIQEANRRVHQRSIEDPGAAGMGTTMTVAVVEDGTVRFGHVGDSRAYLIREGRLEQLTDDHSLVGELVRSGRLSPEEAESHPQRAVITRALGTEPDVDVDTFTVEAEPDDIYLLCSDGLTDMVSGSEILALVERSGGDLDEAARGLVNAANAGGGDDNITVVLFQIGADHGDGETARIPAAAAAEPEPAEDDDEDTLSPLDNVPAIGSVPAEDTAVVPVEAVQEELRRSEERRERRADDGGRRIVPLVLLVLVLLALLALALWGIWR